MNKPSMWLSVCALQFCALQLERSFMNANLIAHATKLRDLIISRRKRFVLVESCTGGWLAASLATLPGISQWWCGSLVVYRCGSKHQWLGISDAMLADPHVGPVSELVTVQLARQALAHTSEADLSLAVTGDLGPGVSLEKDGIVFCAMAIRGVDMIFQNQTRLVQPAPRDAADITARAARLEEASHWAFDSAHKWLLADLDQL
jgi:nicotinamide-nucleotide amidase